MPETLPDQAARPDTLPAISIALIGVATGLLWVGVGVAILGYLIAGAPPLSGVILGGLPQQEGFRQIVLWQWGQTGMAMLAILGLGTAFLITLGQGSVSAARRIAIWLVRILIVVAIMGQILSAAIPVTLSGSVMAAATTLISGLPLFLAQLAFLTYAEWSLRVQA